MKYNQIIQPLEGSALPSRTQGSSLDSIQFGSLSDFPALLHRSWNF